MDFHGLLPQLCPADSGSKPKVTMQETSALWDKLVRVYLMDGELPYTLDDVSALLEVGRKYNIAGMPARMRYALLQPAFLKTEPIRVHLTAIAYGLQDTARTAARLTHKLPNLHHAALNAQRWAHD
ncbi:hypothetical protein C2E23DRAFT_863625 [Lenzites betulinus]|nr:hypothetical protein C2E23DRAFT_863625 [Lenzites betulinus]